jgi:peptidoglycan L-alanyl-D-glutamate endopeptidase CwlK
MNPLDIPDRNPAHLQQAFRTRLDATLAEVEQATGEPWEIVEGYRSSPRQHWVYGQGRRRPGKIVTWKLEPTWHGAGLASDVKPVRTGYEAPRAWWEKLQEIGRRHGLSDPAWAKGDLGHLQLTDPRLSVLGFQWAAKGFPPGEDPSMTAPGPQTETAHLTLFGKPTPAILVPDGFGHWKLREGGEEIHVRNLADALGLPIAWNAATRTVEAG